MKVYLGRPVSGELGPRALEAVQLAHRALIDAGADVLCERVADPEYRTGDDRPELIAEMMRRELLEADAGCLEASGRSTGVGFEAGWLSGRGARRARPLPAHSIVTASVIRGSARMSSSVSSSGRRTCPSTRSRHVAGSTSGMS